LGAWVGAEAELGHRTAERAVAHRRGVSGVGGVAGPLGAIPRRGHAAHPTRLEQARGEVMLVSWAAGAGRRPRGAGRAGGLSGVTPASWHATAICAAVSIPIVLCSISMKAKSNPHAASARPMSTVRA